MATPNCYSTEVRRYGNRLNLYSSYPERRGTAYPIHPDSRSTMSDRDDDVTPQRKRIAVACGRCRKRKIRCSGDTGNGGPCTNCKNAGYEPCQFLRVASQETSLKGEGFNYSLDASRQYQARGSSAISPLPSTASSYPDGIPAYTTEAFVYRAPANFGYGSKSYCPLSWSNGYADDQGYSYALYQPSYSSVHDSDYSMSYRIASGTPGKSALCVDTEPDYAYSSGNTMTNLVHRPAQVSADSTSVAYQSIVSDSKSLSLQSMASDPKGIALQNLPAGINMGDRVLPAPVGRFSMSSSMGSSYKNDSGSSIYSSNSSKSSQASTSETSPVSSTSETPSSYTSYESSSLASTSSCVPSYPPIALASQYGRSSNDLYSHTGSSDASLFASTDSMRQGPDMTYRYTDTTSAVTAAAVASSSGRRDLPHLNGSGISSLSLGHGAASYLPHQSTTYMLPTGGDIGSVGADNSTDHYRKSTGSL
ncbi:transcriptional regulatory [Fusarium longipes]|uniref:Transcriptional regulatory n=1 Tax=Fusarium longipes TaxID=694270 RepID=A0A395T2L9_9HYPO|nr:transcriptional regulatory [Fusarium longipes]